MRQAGPTSIPIAKPTGSNAIAKSNPPTTAAAEAGPSCEAGDPDADRDSDGGFGDFRWVVAATPVTGGPASR